MFKQNALYYGNNLNFLRDPAEIPPKSIDLVYLDPPFNSNRNYNIIFKPIDKQSPASQIKAFEDTWSWDDSSIKCFDEIFSDKNVPADTKNFMKAMEEMLGHSAMLAYLSQMAIRLVYLRRSLKDTGSLYLHCDGTAAHYLKLLLDSIFGVKNYLNNIVWLYGLGGSSKRYWPKKHDDILWYAKDSKKHYFEADKIPATSQRLKGQMKKCPDYWDIPTLNNMAKERLGYPTQKPLALLTRVVKSSCPLDGVVLDPFCGGGTTMDAVELLNRKEVNASRKWIGIDVTHLAVNIVKHRLSQFNPAPKYRLRGEPLDTASAKQLAQEDPFQFQYWACGLAGALPAKMDSSQTGRAAPGGDGGIDGVRYFRDSDGKVQKILFQVKGKKPTLSEVRDFARVIERDSAAIGVFIALGKYSEGMKTESLGLGSYTDSDDKVLKYQLVTVEQLLEGGTPRRPSGVQLPVRAELDGVATAEGTRDDGSLFIER